PLLTPSEVQTLTEWNRTEKDYPRNKTLFELFEEQVQRTPQAEALICGERRLSYRELYTYAMRVASSLQRIGVGSGALVGICLERSWEMVAAILGTLRAGGAYVPMDPAYPRERLAFMLQDAKVQVLLTQQKQRAALPRGHTGVVRIEDALAGDARQESWAVSGPRQTPAIEGHGTRETSCSPLAYVIYTSGSTGQPKGVALEHRSAVAFVHWAAGVFSGEELNGVLASTSICFDLSIFEMFVPLSLGGKIILVENALALPKAPAANEVRMINTVPSAIRELLRAKAVPPSVQVVNLA